MVDILYTPNREQVVTTNAWAYLHWLRTVRGIDLPDWPALQRWSVTDQAAFGLAITEFARLPNAPLPLARHPGQQEALVLRRADGERVSLRRDDIGARGSRPVGAPSRPWPGLSRPLVAAPAMLGTAGISPAMTEKAARTSNIDRTLRSDLAAPLTRLWPPALLIRPMADLLLHTDLRPDDRLLVVGSAAWPWLAALLEGTTVILAAATPATLLATAADEAATVLVAPAHTLAEAAFQRARRRPNLAHLRMIIATGGPLSPEGRTRIYTWIKSDLMLLARTDDTFWGNPLEPVYARPAASRGFFTPPASDPATP
jgi:hypothetical protein